MSQQDKDEFWEEYFVTERFVQLDHLLVVQLTFDLKLVPLGISLKVKPSKLFVEITLQKDIGTKSLRRIMMTRNRHERMMVPWMDLRLRGSHEWFVFPKNYLCQTEPSTGARYSSLPMPFYAMQMQFCVRDTVHTKRCSPLLSREGGQKCFNKDNSHSGTTQVAVGMKTCLRKVSTMI